MRMPIFPGVISRLLAGVLAVGVGIAAGGAGIRLPSMGTNAQSPATTSAPAGAANRTETAKVVKADDLLAKFPAGIALAPKGTRVTIEGRIASMLGVAASQPAGMTRGAARRGAAATTQSAAQPAPTDVRIFLVGATQDADDPNHVTCTIEASAVAQASALKAGQIVQITGTAGDTTPAMNRFDLTHCDSLRAVPRALTPTEQIVGQWGGPMPPTLVGSFTFKADQTMTATFIVNGQGKATLAGKWHQAESDDRLPSYSITLDKTDGPVELELNQGTLYIPSIPPLFTLMGTGKGEFHRSFGMPEPMDFRAPQALTQQWLHANIAVAQPQTIYDSATSFMQRMSQNGDGYLIVIGGGLTRSHKTTLVGAMNTSPFTFELTAAQAAATGVAANATAAKALRTHFGAMAPEVKIESLVLDDKGAYDPSQPLTGKITLRALKAVPDGEYALMMEYGNGVIMNWFDAGIGLDTQTLPFSFAPLVRTGEPSPTHLDNPTVLFFSMARDQRVSDTIPMLVDVKP